jgi:pimeloyl-ACP methyl ester carboxylesterase
MKKHPFWRMLGIVLAVLLLLVGVGPFLVPAPPLEGTRPIAELADADSMFMEINGLSVHYKTMGSGEPLFVLLHGFGASLYSWHAVMEPFSELGRVFTYDCPAFGLTGRPLEWEGENPYSLEAQVNLLLAMLDDFAVGQVILVGNSAGGTVAIQFTLDHPERVQALILVDPAVYAGGGAPAWTRPLLRTPQMRHLGPLIARQIQARGPDLLDLAWYDPSRIPAESMEMYQKPLLVENWDKAL